MTLKDFDLNREAHKYSDKDVSRESLHHTIGKGENQAASGAEFKEAAETLETLVTRVQTLEDAKLATQAWSAVSSAGVNPVGTGFINVTGQEVTVPVEETTDVFLVILSLCAFNNNSDSTSIIARLVADGAVQGTQTIRISDAAAGNQIPTAAQTWIVTGLAEGDRVFRGQVQLTSAGSWTTDPNRCVITVVKING